MLYPIELASPRLCGAAAPLLEEEIDACGGALVFDFENPLFVHRARLRAAFSSDDDPGDALKINVADRTEQRLYGKKANPDRRLLKMANSGGSGMVFYRNSAPNVPRRSVRSIPILQVTPHERASLGKHLKDVPVGSLHGVENAVDEIYRYVFVEKVAHGIDEDFAWPLPGKRLRKPFRAERKVEALLEGMSRCAPKSLGDSLSVAIIATARDLGAARNWIPRGVRPFNSGFVAHLPGPHAVLIAGASTLAVCANALQTLQMGEIHRRISAFRDSRKIQVKVYSDQRPFFRDCFQEGSVR